MPTRSWLPSRRVTRLRRAVDRLSGEVTNLEHRVDRLEASMTPRHDKHEENRQCHQ